jgi:hypothetical protein
MAFAAAHDPIAVEYSSKLINNHPTHNPESKRLSETQRAAPAQEQPEWMTLYHRDKVFEAFVNDLLSFHYEDDEPPPSADAIEWILETTVLAKQILAQNWKNPRITSDDQGGVRLSWRDGDRELRAVVPADLSGRYLYWQQGAQYGGFPNFGSATLYSRLSKMNEQTSR